MPLKFYYHFSFFGRNKKIHSLYNRAQLPLKTQTTDYKQFKPKNKFTQLIDKSPKKSSETLEVNQSF